MKWFKRKEPTLNEKIYAELQEAAGMTLMQINTFGGVPAVRKQLQSMFALGYIMGITEAAVDKIAPHYKTTPQYEINIGAAYMFTFQDENDGEAAQKVAMANQDNKDFKIGKNAGFEDFRNYDDFKTMPHYLSDMILKELG